MTTNTDNDDAQRATIQIDREDGTWTINAVLTHEGIIFDAFGPDGSHQETAAYEMDDLNWRPA